MTRMANGLVIWLFVVSAALSSCSGGTNARSASTTTTQAELRTAPVQCAHINIVSLGTAGHSVRLDRVRSVLTEVSGNRSDIHCLYNDTKSGAELGSIALTTYVNAADAHTAYNSARQSDTALGVSATPETFGQSAFAVDQGTAWSCLILDGNHIASAALTGADAATACRWADLGLTSL